MSRTRESVPLREVADHIDRRMAGKSGTVTLHYTPKGFVRVQYGDYEDADAMPTRRSAK
ncbi:MAG: hypothetical protein AAF389_14930 [Gemmatimonadota bacterium]